MSSETGYRRAIDLLHQASSPHGFMASLVERNNYRRIWARDGGITSIAALMSDESALVESARQTLLTLAKYQGPHGEIPSNVDPSTESVSYGGTAGRVDADLWFLIACGQYWRHTGDDRFLEEVMEAIEKVRFLLGCWEFNNRGLLYVPQTGDWADEFLQHGYVLYDQLLYLQAQRELAAIHSHLHESCDHGLHDRIARLTHLIRANYWFTDGDDAIEDAYHATLYEQGRDAAPRRRGRHWMPFFTPTGYGYRFDTFANVLCSLLDVASDEHREEVDCFVDATVVDPEMDLLPAFYPVVTPRDEAWDDLQMTFRFTFKNRPHEYHNGGLWAMVTGFHVADLARRGKQDQARAFLDGIHRANGLPDGEGNEWSFPEFVHGRDHTPGGMRMLAWNAAGAIIGHCALEGRRPFLD
ncbi:Plant neutral invertase [Maioricimonas rarisocia]|uniref:beta-fructofuranosidase n=1 Tax=Maioricimonas rarisocia TaxID=2528026 RepID=A0A517Z652_9PLAN|nr:amylo-alpha-1,6-glucosidase [Maioricimonas rarisocia]QDU37957.1 Plant neutral invertase [Maioricimonas rarisocia]